MYGSVKFNKIRENEKKLKALHGTILLYCTNPECKGKVKVNYKDVERTFTCSKCMKGTLVREKELNRIREQQNQIKNQKPKNKEDKKENPKKEKNKSDKQND